MYHFHRYFLNLKQSQGTSAAALQGDVEMECILRMCIHLLALQLLSSPSTRADAPASARPSAADECDASASGPAAAAAQESPTAAAAPVAGDGGPGGAADTRSKSFLPALTAADFDGLQSHAEELPPRERQDWLRAAKFLQTALRVRRENSSFRVLGQNPRTICSSKTVWSACAPPLFCCNCPLGACVFCVHQGLRSEPWRVAGAP